MTFPGSVQPRRILLFLFLFLTSTPLLLAYPNGITGQYQAGCGGGACHGGAASANTTVTLQGPTNVKAGSTSDYTFIVDHANNDYAGLNVAFTNAQGAVSGTFTPGNGSRAEGNQLTHTQPKAFTGGQGEFPFQWTAPAAHGTYTFRGAGNAVNNNNNNTGDVWNTMSQQITVTGATVTAPTAGTSKCQGEDLVISWTQTGLTTLRIELSMNNFQTITVVNNSIAATAGTYTYSIPADMPAGIVYIVRLVDTRDDSEVGRSATFAINGTPQISTEPESQEVCKGRTLQLVVGAVGTGLTYQWRKGGTNINGATTATLRITNVGDADAGSYDCVITGCNTPVTSQAATITIATPPSITQQAEGANVCEGQTVSFTIAAEGTALTYQWLKNGVPIIGATNTTYQIVNSTFTDEGEYACRITGTCTPQIVTDTVELNIIDPPTVTTQPTGKTLEVGDKLTLSVAATGELLQYQWLRNGVELAGKTDSILVVESVVLSDSGSYTCKVSNTCDSTLSSAASIKVKPKAGPGNFVLGTATSDIGEHPMCAIVEHVIQGGLQNTGGSPITVTGFTADPSTITVVSPSFPVEIGSGESKDIVVRVDLNGSIEIGGSIVFTEEGGDETLAITGTGLSVIVVDKDTLEFNPAAPGEELCLWLKQDDCPTAMVTEITISGAGSDAFEISTAPELPFELLPGDSVQICVKSTASVTEAAELGVATAAGNAKVVLMPGVVNSVQEGDIQIAGLTVAPNPMQDQVVISTPTDRSMKVAIYTVVGRQVASLEGQGTIRWNRRDNSGTQLPSGLYVLVIEQGMERAVAKLLVE